MTIFLQYLLLRFSPGNIIHAENYPSSLAKKTLTYLFYLSSEIFRGYHLILECSHTVKWFAFAHIKCFSFQTLQNSKMWHSLPAKLSFVLGKCHYYFLILILIPILILIFILILSYSYSYSYSFFKKIIIITAMQLKSGPCWVQSSNEEQGGWGTQNPAGWWKLQISIYFFFQRRVAFWGMFYTLGRGGYSFRQHRCTKTQLSSFLGRQEQQFQSHQRQCRSPHTSKLPSRNSLQPCHSWKSFNSNSSSSQEWCSSATLGLRRISNLILALSYISSNTVLPIFMLHSPQCESLCPVLSYFTGINQPKSSFLPWRLKEHWRCILCERCRLTVGFSSSNSSGIKFTQNDLSAFCC